MTPHALTLPITMLAEELLGFFRRRAPAEAEELAQETWLRVSAAEVAPEGVRPFAYVVARRLLIDRHRRTRTRPALDPLDEGRARSSSDPHGELVAARALAVVERCLGEMKPEVAQVFRWRTTSDISFAEIAARQGCSLNTALGRHHHATRTLARALREADLGDP